MPELLSINADLPRAIALHVMSFMVVGVNYSSDIENARRIN